MITSNFLNKLLQFDPKSQDQMIKLCDHIVRIEFKAFPFVLDLCFKKNVASARQEEVICVAVSSRATAGATSSLNAPSVTLRASHLTYFVLFVTQDIQKAKTLGLTIEGDMEVAQDFQKWAMEVEIDWEEILSHFSGDYLAPPIGTFARKMRVQNKSFVNKLLTQTGDYLQEEIKVLPTEYEINEFLNEIDQFRRELDRLEAMISVREVNLNEKENIMDLEYK